MHELQRFSKAKLAIMTIKDTTIHIAKSECLKITPAQSRKTCNSIARCKTCEFIFSVYYPVDLTVLDLEE